MILCRPPNQAGFPLVLDVLETMSSQLRIVHHNVQGLQSKWLELVDWLQVTLLSPAVFKTWHDSDSLPPVAPRFHSFWSPLLSPKSSNSRGPLLGSGIFLLDVLLPEHPPICDEIENSSLVSNVTCCFATCVSQKMAVVDYIIFANLCLNYLLVLSMLICLVILMLMC